MITIRPEQIEDFENIADINRIAFGRDVEAGLVEKIRRSDNFIPELSLVALKDGLPVGHAIFSRIKISKENNEEAEALTLGPIAVLPEFQRQGIGSLLMSEGMEKAKSMGFGAIVLIGHPDYYPRFGFVQARGRGLEIFLKVKVPDEAFMVYEIENGFLGLGGIVEYPDYFNE